MNTAAAAIYRGEVVHKRLHPVEHRLRYSVFSFAIDLDRLADTADGLRLFSVDRFNLFGLSQADHGYRDGTSLCDFAWSEVRKCGVERDVARIVMMVYPRLLGFAFNPLTVYFCLSKEGAPVLMIYEVRNTFGQNLTYVVAAGGGRNGSWSHSIEKQFHVSPFNQVEGHYDFHVLPPDETVTFGVALRVGGKPTLRTHFRGTRLPLNDSTLLRMFVTHPMMSAKIVGGIHLEALKLWRKGLTINTIPDAPPEAIVYGEGISVTASGV